MGQSLAGGEALTDSLRSSARGQRSIDDPEKPLTHQRIGFDLNALPLPDTVAPPIFAEGNFPKALGHKAPKTTTAKI